MSVRQRIAKFGGGGGGAGSRLPRFAEDIAAILFRDPQDAFSQQYPGGLGAGIFGDIRQGYDAIPASQMFGGLGGLIPRGQQVGENYSRLAEALGYSGAGAANQLAGWGTEGALDSRDYNRLNDRFLEQAGRGYNSLMDLVTGGGQNFAPRPGLRGSYGVGTVGQEALNASRNVGPDSELYRSTLSFLTPQVRAAYSARGMGNSGAAVGAEGDQARQLADQFAQRAQQERNAFLQTAAGSEGTAAGFQGAYNNALAQMYGQELGTGANIFGTRMQGALGATEAPARIFSTMQGGLGQGIQNIGQAAGQYLLPLQMAQAGLAGANAGMQTPIQLQQMIYNYLRSPQSQLLGVPSSTGQQQLGSHPNGLFGDLLGFEKGG